MSFHACGANHYFSKQLLPLGFLSFSDASVLSQSTPRPALSSSLDLPHIKPQDLVYLTQFLIF